MAKILIILSALVCLASCASKLPKNKVIKEYASPANAFIDTSRVAILSYDNIYNKTTKKNKSNREYKQSELSEQEVQTLDSLYSLAVCHFFFQHEIIENEDSRITQKFIDMAIKFGDSLNYKRQYIVVTNRRDEKEVWVNCFCTDFGKNRKKQYIYVRDGGPCFFNFKINLTMKKYYDFHVNGSA